MNFDALNCAPFGAVYKKNLLIITDNRLTELGVEHGFTTRMGGVSSGAYGSLNLAWSAERQDSLENVDRNYNILLAAFDTRPCNAVKTNQLHTDRVECTDSLGGVGFTKPEFEFGVDGLVSRTDSQLLTVRMADCMPILLYDKRTRAVGAVHSGWKGTLQRIGAKAVEKMCLLYNSRKSDILVSMGPSVAPCCYEVGEDFRDSFISEIGGAVKDAFHYKDGKLFADMRFINRFVIQESGIPGENIAVYVPCTSCNGEYFFSHRRQKAQRGTMAGVIKCSITPEV